MTTVTYLSKDQDYQNYTTTYWFDVDGETYGVAESCGSSTIVDCDGCPGNAPHSVAQALSEAVTEEMRQDF